MAQLQKKIPLDKIKLFCEQWQIIEFAVFGSVTTDNFTKDSDIDIIITFASDSNHTLFDMIEMNTELEKMLGRKVDLLTRNSVENSPNYIHKKEILESMQVLYAA